MKYRIGRDADDRARGIRARDGAERMDAPNGPCGPGTYLHPDKRDIPELMSGKKRFCGPAPKARRTVTVFRAGERLELKRRRADRAAENEKLREGWRL